MKNILVIKVMQLLLTVVSPDLIRELFDELLDRLETKILESKNKIDDHLALPVIRQLRIALNIPDDDDAPGNAGKPK